MRVENACYQFLGWDSDFFGFRVGQADLSKGSTRLLDDALQSALRDDVSLLVVHADEAIREKLPYSMFLADKPVTYDIDYRKNHFWKRHIDSPVRAYAGFDSRAKLDRLAMMAGEHSRYYFDTLFPKADADRLFVTWVDRALNNPDQTIHVASDPLDGIVAMLISRVLHIDGRTVGNPALLSVVPQWRGRNFTQQFCKASCDWFLERDVTYGQVVTQSRNHVARAIYESLNWTLRSERYCYHIWLRPLDRPQTRAAKFEAYPEKVR